MHKWIMKISEYWTKGNIIGWPDICWPNRPKIFPFVQYLLIHDLAHKAIKSAINSWKTSNTTSWDLWQEDEKLLATVIIVKSRKVREKKWFVQKNFTPLILMLGSRFIFPMTNLFWNFDFKFGIVRSGFNLHYSSICTTIRKLNLHYHFWLIYKRYSHLKIWFLYIALPLLWSLKCSKCHSWKCTT